MKKNLLLLVPFLSLLNYFPLHAQNHKILESTSDYIKIEVNFENTYQIKEKTYNGEKFSVIEGKEIFLREPGEPWLPNYIINIGIPINSTPDLKILNTSQEKKQNVFILPTPDSLNQPFDKLPFDGEIYNSNVFFPKSSVMIEDYIVRYAHLANLKISAYQFNPVSRELLFNRKLIIQVDFKTDANVIVSRIDDDMTDNILKSQVINYDFAKDFQGKEIIYSDSPAAQDTYWYNPQKDYYKIYLNKEGVYRITYDYLVNAGVPSSGLLNNRLELFCNGESVPLDVVDVDSNGFFNSGDYFQFVGYPAKPADEYTRMNIYNKSNVYWFSYQADTLNYYKNINGYPTGFSETISNTVHTLRWEKDLIYNPLGHSGDSKRDYWYWQIIEARNGTPYGYFLNIIEDSIWSNLVVDKPQGRIKVGLHGLTTPPCQNGYAHKAAFIFNGHEFGSIKWDGQKAEAFDKVVYFSFNGSSGDTLWVRWQNNQELDIYLTGEVCNSDTLDDQVLVNYIELQYWRWNRTYPNYFYFTSPPGNYQDNKYYLWQWQRDNMKIYIPQRGELISNPWITNDQELSVWFQDTVYEQTNYYCVADDYFISPDSIVHEVNNSDLRNTTNGADYIIITHPFFIDAANQLATYRLSNLPGYDFPRVKIVNVFDIYKEFSYGLLNPFALRDFAKYIFENWQQPAPSFITLLGDASFDYRKIFPSSRDNFVPSIPYHGFQYGQLPSDNSIVMVDGDEYPDIAIGRLSCETPEEANILVNKILNYPADNTKPWKENVILLASGLNYSDQQLLQFNNRAKELERDHLLPNGINSTKVFNFPDTTTNDIQFWGDGPRMRQEINKGAVVVSYYGHGGGAQWDLIFTKDDIPELNNGGKLPFISSITCYTAHFSNAESFGEIFIKVPNKGAIGFWGSVSLTWWPTGHFMNKELFNNLFTKRNYIIGSAILNTFTSNIGTPMIRQIAYLGDPALELVIPEFPDFEIKSSDITISPEFPLKDDTVAVSIKIRNLGVIFPNDSVTIELFKNTTDTSNLIGEIKFPSFGHEETTLIDWIPGESGLYNIIARINGKNIIEEIDHSDNIASRSFSVFDFGKPNIIKPTNGYFSNNETIEFVLSDIGSYFEREFNYIIQINDIPQFDEASVLIQSPVLNPIDGIVRWESAPLQMGEYFWRSIIYDQIDTNTSFIRTFAISNSNGSGYLAQKKHLQLFDSDNIDYVDELGILKLNTKVKPPHPDERFFLDSIKIIPPEDSTRIVIYTTDGTYFYFTDLPEFISKPKIYKIGTGLNGTIPGKNYGPIPDPLSPTEPLSVSVRSHMFCMNGFLYVSTGGENNILRINPFSGDTLSVFLTDSLILTNSTSTQLGGYYFYYDGQYVYNLAMGSPLRPDKFVLRTLDPINNWKKVREDIILSGSLVPNVNSFIVVDSTIILLENRFQYYLRSYRLPVGTFLEEWRHSNPPRGYFAIAYDYQNNFVYFSLLKPGVQPGFERYLGKFIDANGRITSPEIGPASKWHNLQFEIDQTNSNGTYKAYLLGKNQNSGSWETLDTLNQSNASLENVNAYVYKYLQLDFELADSSFGADEPMKFNSLQVNYDYLPEISVIPKDMTFAPDSMLQGINVNMNLKVHNYGYINADSLRIDFYLNDGDSVFFTKYLNVKVDSFEVIDRVIKTDTIIFDTKLKAVATTPVGEYFTFNNLVENDFYVARDSTKPIFNITFDGQEILDGDIVSSRPEVVITLKDNTPLLWDESHFTIVYDNEPLDFAPDTLVFEQVSPYPNSEVRVIWTPFIQEDGEHTLEVLAKDPSGNFFDSTSYRVSFFVFNNSDLRDVYNYPNPFGDNTHFTFELRGVSVPEELRIRIYTIAGRMIKELKIPSSLLQIGFNSIYWDGKDHDGDEIANGLYFYKVVYKNDDVVKTVTQKLAKIK